MKKEQKEPGQASHHNTMHELLMTECECAADKHASTSRVKLAPEDTARMQRIYEEINARLVEANGIISRNLGRYTTSYSVARMTGLGASKNPIVTPLARSPHPLLVCSIDGNCGYYDWESGECYSC